MVDDDDLQDDAPDIGDDLEDVTDDTDGTDGTEASDQPAAAVDTARDELRRRLAADVEAFLQRGGTIEHLPRNLRADPPAAPSGNYGRRSI